MAKFRLSPRRTALARGQQRREAERGEHEQNVARPAHHQRQQQGDQAEGQPGGLLEGADHSVTGLERDDRRPGRMGRDAKDGLGESFERGVVVDLRRRPDQHAGLTVRV